MLTRDSVRGVLVAVEGLDRCGKSTQAEMLRRALESAGFRAVAVRSPDRRLRDLIASGHIVVADRYSHTRVAYGAASGLSPVRCAVEEAGLPQPDVVVFIDVTPAVAEERGGAGGGEAFHLAARAELLRMTDASWCVVDGTAPPPQVHARIMERVLSEIRAVDDTDRPLAFFCP